MICALTGHRALRAGFDEIKLESALRALIGEGADTFFCGMAMGFDLVCCKILASLKREFPIKIVACIPCADQSGRFPAQAKKMYGELLEECDEKVVLHETYCDGCMFERNRYMVDRCDVLLAYLLSEKGGTAYTVRYAQKRGKKVVFFFG